MFWPYGPKKATLWATSKGELKEKPIIFQGNPVKIFPRNHSKNGSKIENNISLSTIDLPIKLMKKNATPQKTERNAGKPTNTNGIIQRNSSPSTKIALLIQ